MSDALYFLPIIAEALSKLDTKGSLLSAFDQIQNFGSQKRYHHGYENFMRFMTEAYGHHEILNDDQIRQIMLEIILSTDEFSALEKEVLMKMVVSSDWHQKEFGEIDELIRHSANKNRYPVIEIFCNRKRIGRIELTKQMPRQSIAGIVSGEYVLKLDTGWVLWQGQFTDKDLLWKKAFGKKDLKLAADSGQTSPEPVRQIPLLDGRIIVRVFAGIESGMIEVQRRDPHGN